jgi:hypothetical protein
MTQQGEKYCTIFSLFETGVDVGLEVNTEKIKYMLVSCHLDTGKNIFFLTVNKSFENVAKSKYLRTVTNQNCIHEEIKEQTEFGECLIPFCSESVFPSHLKNLKDYNTHNHTSIFVFYQCETWPLTLREENTLMMFENRVLRRIF